jgi:hypothetical protein
MKRVPSICLAGWLALGAALPGVSQVARPRRSTSAANPSAIPEEPLATFSGAVQDIDKKILRVKSEEANVLQFVCSRKTQYFDGDKKIKGSDIKPGDHVSVDSKRFRDGELEAINVHVERPKTENAGARKTS